MRRGRARGSRCTPLSRPATQGGAPGLATSTASFGRARFSATGLLVAVAAVLAAPGAAAATSSLWGNSGELFKDGGAMVDWSFAGERLRCHARVYVRAPGGTVWGGDTRARSARFTLPLPPPSPPLPAGYKGGKDPPKPSETRSLTDFQTGGRSDQKAFEAMLAWAHSQPVGSSESPPRFAACVSTACVRPPPLQHAPPACGMHRVMPALPPRSHAAGHIVLAVPAGTYTITRPLFLARSKLVLRGAGPSKTILKLPNSLTDVYGGLRSSGLLFVSSQLAVAKATSTTNSASIPCCRPQP